MVIQDERLMELQQERYLLIKKIDNEQDDNRRATLISHLTIVEARIEKRLVDLNVRKIPEKIIEKVEEAVVNNDFDSEEFLEAKKLNDRPDRTGLVILKEKHEIAAQLIAFLDSKGYNKLQKQKILSNAYQKLYRGKK